MVFFENKNEVSINENENIIKKTSPEKFWWGFWWGTNQF